MFSKAFLIIKSFMSSEYSSIQIYPKYRPEIDGLRAIAVLSVVAFHAFPEWVSGGFIGVDIFFVISGFLITTIIFENLNQNTFSFANFYSRRIKRIFPALLLVLTTCYIAGWLILLPDEFMQLGKHIAGGASFLSNFFLWNESGYFDNIADTKPLLHLWSLGIEEQFYIVWPVLLWLTWNRRGNFLAIILIALVSFIFSIATIYTNPVEAFFSPLSRFWELMVGSIIAYIVLYKKNIVSRWGASIDRISIISLIFLIAGTLVLRKTNLFPGWWVLIPTLSCSLLILSSPNAWVNRKILANRVLAWFGLISFPLYLWHWPLLSFARIIQGEVRSELRIALIIISIGLAWLTYKFFEIPIRKGDPSRLKVSILILFMILVGYAGFNVFDREGLKINRIKYRYNNELLNKLAIFKYPHEDDRYKTCFLEDSQDSKFENCPAKMTKGKPTLIIWGDSQAAYLYSGYKSMYEEKFNLIQRNAASCPPILNSGSVWCQGLNRDIFELINKIRPDWVVLGANWSQYDYGWNGLSQTIVSLKNIGIKRIDVIGHVPQWHDSLRKQLYLYNQKYPNEPIPIRMKFGLNEKIFILDEKFATFSKQQGVNYFSPISVLCNDEGCITRFGDDPTLLTTFDYGHLTVSGAKHVVSRFSGN